MKALVLTFTLISSSLWAQSPDPFDRIFEQMEQRMNEMMNRFGNDSMMRDLFEDDFRQLGFTHSAFDYHYTQDDKGRTLIIKPNTPENNLEIKIQDDSVQISGKVKIEKVDKTQYGESKSVSIQSVNQSLPVPQDTDGNKNKISSNKTKEGEEIHIFFPYKNGKPNDPGFLPESRGFAKQPQKLKKKRKQFNDDGTIPLFENGGPSETI